ncbi:MAG: hypothetical protein OXF74_13535 [Rhodobacteraceae bacterium]|nr:hypothetical protein [Paracoccaceae bacterium]
MLRHQTRRSAALPAALSAFLLTLPGCLKQSESALDREVATRIADCGRAVTGLARRDGTNGGIRIAGRPWYGSARGGAEVGPERGQKLPANLERGGGVALSIPGQTGIREAAALISRTAGIPVKVNLALPAVPQGGGEGGGPIRHDGPLSVLLDRVGSEYDVFWRFDGGAIILSAFETRTWPLSAAAGATTVNSSFAGLAGGQGSMSISRSAQFDDWAEIGQLLSVSIQSPPAVVTMSPGLGLVSVTGRPSDIAAAGKIIGEVAARASQRISFEIGIYYLDADCSEGFSTCLTRLAFGEAGEGRSLTLAAQGGSVSILGAAGGVGFGLDFEDVARHDSVLTHRTASTVTVSGGAVPIRLVSTRNYVASVSVSEEGQRSIETESVDDGIAIQIIPRLIDRGLLRLSLLVGQADLLGFDRFLDVQLPRVDYRQTANDVVMEPGETLVLSGYEQGAAGLNAESGLLSASASADVERIMLVVLIRPTLRPLSAGR